MVANPNNFHSFMKNSKSKNILRKLERTPRPRACTWQRRSSPPCSTAPTPQWGSLPASPPPSTTSPSVRPALTIPPLLTSRLSLSDSVDDEELGITTLQVRAEMVLARAGSEARNWGRTNVVCMLCDQQASG